MSSKNTNDHFPQNDQPSCSRNHYYDSDDVIIIDELPSSPLGFTEEPLLGNSSKQNIRKLEKQTSLTEPILIDLTQEVEENIRQNKVNSSNSDKNIFVDLTEEVVDNINDSQINFNDGWLNKRHHMVFTCHFCRQKFANKKQFKHHLVEHREFQCRYCLREFGRTSDLTRHMRTSHI